MAMHGGYYAICSISHAGTGPLKDHDHWVMLCGQRSVRVPLDEEGSARIDEQVLVSCSAKSPEGFWINHLNFLKNHGGYNAILVKPAGGED
jgi:hypothetical protein